jgi:SAM-dependent methyltransferase
MFGTLRALASTDVLGYNKLCELEDFEEATFRLYAGAIFARDARISRFTPTNQHRKVWEVVQATRALTELGAVHRHAEILGVAAGVEETSFWLTNHVRRVFAIDRYLDPAGWDRDAPRSMLLTPGEHAPCAWNEQRLVVQHMDARELRYVDGSFDGVFCSSSLEHFGGEQDLRRALAEMWRVLKPGGIATLSTEFRLRGPPPGLPGTLMFDGAELDELIVRAFPWELVQPLDLSISERTLTTKLRLADAVAATAPRFPHIVLTDGDLMFTSVHLALRKPAAA